MSLELASSTRPFLEAAELTLGQSTMHPWTEEIIQNVRKEEVDGQDAAPDACDPVDEPLVAGEDIDGEDEQHHGDEDSEVLKESHALVSTVACFAVESLFLRGGLGVVYAAV